MSKIGEGKGGVGVSYPVSGFVVRSYPAQWKPMESAPRDGTAILVYSTYDFEEIVSVRWGIWRSNVADDWQWLRIGDEDVSHNEQFMGGWMPIPEPPK